MHSELFHSTGQNDFLKSTFLLSLIYNHLYWLNSEIIEEKIMHVYACSAGANAPGPDGLKKEFQIVKTTGW